MRDTVNMPDGLQILVRPLTKDDEDRSLAFFRELSDESREYLRSDVTQREVVQNRIRTMELGQVERLVAVAGEQIVADGAMELSSERWTSHVAEMRLIVGDQYQKHGLGTLMARHLYRLAASRDIDRIMVAMARPQIGAQKIVRRLGFQEEATLPGHVKSRSGSSQDLILMSCDLETLWRELEIYYAESDWQRAM